MKQCAYCGAEVPEAKIACPACGKSLFSRPASGVRSRPPEVAVKSPPARRFRVRPLPILFSVICLLFGFFVVWIFGQVKVVHCTRVEPRQVDCRVQSKWLGWLPAGRPVVVPGVRSARARLETSEYYDQMDRVYLELSGASTSGQLDWITMSQARDVAEQINRFIRDEQGPEVEIRSAPGWFIQACGAFLFADLLFFSVLMFRWASSGREKSSLSDVQSASSSDSGL